MLTERQLLVLQVIINDFIRSAQPIGSRTLSKKEELSFSSATIRNEMADLEELGLIEKTHTSSGRVPSEKGYRYYVDHLLKPDSLSQKDVTQLQSVFSRRIFELEKVVDKVAEIVSDLTNYTSIALGSAVSDTKLRNIQILPLTIDTAIAIIVTDKGHVEKKLVDIPTTMSPSDLEKMVNILNEKLIGVPFSEIRMKMNVEVAELIHDHIENFEHILQSISPSFHSKSDSMAFSGKMNILNQPEFNDIDKIRDLLMAIERQTDFYQLLKKQPTGIHITIGKENTIAGMESCSLITATYLFDNKQLGTIAVLGPTRMDYSRVVTLLNYLTKSMK